MPPETEHSPDPNVDDAQIDGRQRGRHGANLEAALLRTRSAGVDCPREAKRQLALLAIVNKHSPAQNIPANYGAETLMHQTEGPLPESSVTPDGVADCS